MLSNISFDSQLNMSKLRRSTCWFYLYQNICCNYPMPRLILVTKWFLYFISGSLFHSSAARYVQKSSARFAYLHHIWPHLLFCHQQHRTAVHGPVLCQSGLYIVQKYFNQVHSYWLNQGKSYKLKGRCFCRPNNRDLCHIKLKCCKLCIKVIRFC